MNTILVAAADEHIPATASAHRQAKAPADEYFGRLKMSILGVRNVVAEIDARTDDVAEDVANALCHKLILAEDALRDWQAKYPDDPWVPKIGYAMIRGYEKLDGALLAEASHAAAIHAIDLASWLDVSFPGSEFAPK